MVEGKNRAKLRMAAFFAAFMLLAAAFPVRAVQAQGNAQGGMTIIRDTEIESMIGEWMAPVFAAAGLDPAGVKIILVQSNEMNAFVAGGSNIFVYTGLMEKTDNPGEMIGVLAHEMGHIAGGHLIRSRDAMERASYESVIGAILGVGAAIATGDSSAVPAVALGTGSMAQRRFLAHSRVQEASADQAAMGFLEKAQINPSGLGSFMEKLKAEIYLPTDRQSEYVMTHPLVENRIDALQTRIAQSPYKDKPLPAAWTAQHARMKAKLLGFLHPEQISWVYGDQDDSVPARYARAIAAYRNNNVDGALARIDALLNTEPDNPYFLELKGQMLVDFGRGAEAIPFYRRAVSILPEASLLRIALGHALIESAAGSDAPEEALKEAVGQLERALRDEARSTRLHRLLATACGRLGDEDMARVHLAEEAVLQQRYDYAREQAQGVLDHAAADSVAAVRAKDVLSFIESQEKG